MNRIVVYRYFVAGADCTGSSTLFVVDQRQFGVVYSLADQGS